MFLTICSTKKIVIRKNWLILFTNNWRWKWLLLVLALPMIEEKISQSYYLTQKKLMAYFFTSFIRERVPPKIFFSWSKYFGLENTSYCLYLWWIVILWKNSIFSLLNNKWILLNTLLSNFRIQKKIVWKYFNEKQLLEFLLNSYTKFTRLLELEDHNPLAFRQPRQW